MKKNNGFTLIELIITIVLIGIISSVVGYILLQGINASITGKNISVADWQTQIAFQRMVKEIRSIRSPTTTDISTMTGTQLTFNDSSGTSISYQLSGSTLMRNSQVLADGISNLAFTYLDKNGAVTASAASVQYITVSITLTLNNVTYSVTTLVNPRNT